MAETFHERLRRLGKAKDYVGVISTLRTPFPAERGAQGSERSDEGNLPPDEQNNPTLSPEAEKGS